MTRVMRKTPDAMINRPVKVMARANYPSQFAGEAAAVGESFRPVTPVRFADSQLELYSP